MNCLEVCGGHRRANDHHHRPGLDLWVRSRTASRIEAGGGDLHLVSSCASGRITRMLLADICGYGPLFPKIALQLSELMRQNVNAVQQGRLVREMTSHLKTASQHGGFASTLISTYFAPTRAYTVCNVGHPPPLLFRAERRTWVALKQAAASMATPTDASLGLLDESEYQQFGLHLDPGDMALSFSNALTECCDRDGRILGLDGVLRFAEQCRAHEPAELAGELIGLIEDEYPSNLADVDVTVLLCRATENRVSWKDNLLAPVRLFKSAADRTSLE